MLFLNFTFKTQAHFEEKESEKKTRTTLLWSFIRVEDQV